MLYYSACCILPLIGLAAEVAQKNVKTLKIFVFFSLLDFAVFVFFPFLTF